MNKKLKMVATAVVAIGATGSVALTLAESAPTYYTRNGVGDAIYNAASSAANTTLKKYGAGNCRTNGAFEKQLMSAAFGVSSFTCPSTSAAQ